MSRLDEMLAEYGTTVYEDIYLTVDNKRPTNIALRLSTGEEILISLLDTGREISIDIDAFDKNGDRQLTTMMFTEPGVLSGQVENLKTIVMVRRSMAPEMLAGKFCAALNKYSEDEDEWLNAAMQACELDEDDIMGEEAFAPGDPDCDIIDLCNGFRVIRRERSKVESRAGVDPKREWTIHDYRTGK